MQIYICVWMCVWTPRSCRSECSVPKQKRRPQKWRKWRRIDETSKRNLQNTSGWTTICVRKSSFRVFELICEKSGYFPYFPVFSMDLHRKIVKITFHPDMFHSVPRPQILYLASFLYLKWCLTKRKNNRNTKYVTRVKFATEIFKNNMCQILIDQR